MAEVRWSIIAVDDLELIEHFIARESMVRASQFSEAVYEATERLVAHPRLGRVVPEFGQENIREVFFRGYRIVYSVDENTVIVLTLVHGARDLRRFADRESWDLR